MSPVPLRPSPNASSASLLAPSPAPTFLRLFTLTYAGNLIPLRAGRGGIGACLRSAGDIFGSTRWRIRLRDTRIRIRAALLSKRRIVFTRQLSCIRYDHLKSYSPTNCTRSHLKTLKPVAKPPTRPAVSAGRSLTSGAIRDAAIRLLSSEERGIHATEQVGVGRNGGNHPRSSSSSSSSSSTNSSSTAAAPTAALGGPDATDPGWLDTSLTLHSHMRHLSSKVSSSSSSRSACFSTSRTR
jgi:hypothetical protein